MKLRSWVSGILGTLVVSVVSTGCQGDERLAEKARIEGKETARTELQTQIENIEKRVELARAEGRATAVSELQAQIDHIELISQKARAEGKAQAEAGISATNSNLETKAYAMESDLATRHLFYQAVRGTYEGSINTERGEFKVRITLVPSLPPYTASRVRQLEEIASDLNNLYFHAQVLQWNPANKLSAVGCRAENIRPDVIKGEISIASSNCPNLYKLRVVDPELEKSADDSDNPYLEASELRHKEAEVSAMTASAIREGKLAELTEIRGEIHPTTNAAIYSVSVKRMSAAAK